MLDKSDKDELPVHMILGVSEYSKIKTPAKPRIGTPGDPIADFTTFGCIVSSSADFERLCSLDVLGIQTEDGNEQVHLEFKDKFERSEEGWYHTGLIWKLVVPDLPSMKSPVKQDFTSLFRDWKNSQNCMTNMRRFCLIKKFKELLKRYPIQANQTGSSTCHTGQLSEILLRAPKLE